MTEAELQQAPATNANPLILASRVEHTHVFNRAGERIGHVTDLSIDRKRGCVVYAIMSFGGFLGIGTKLHPIPWDFLEYSTSLGGFVVPISQAELESAPYYDADELAELGGAKHEFYFGKILEYYGPYAPPLF